jgi:hypothetical protein
MTLEERIKYYYNNDLWSIDRVFNVVGKPNSINQNEYYEITGFIYPAKA